eukprot:1176845-Prorocentrum_minimum.AAC.1
MAERFLANSFCVAFEHGLDRPIKRALGISEQVPTRKPTNPRSPPHPDPQLNVFTECTEWRMRIRM